MNLVQAINTYLWVWLETLKGFRRPAVILPFLVFGTLEALLLWSSAHFYQAPFGYFWIPVLEWIPGRAATHYPQYYLLLSRLLQNLDLVLSALVGSITVGWGVLVFRGAYLSQPGALGQGLSGALRRAGALVLIGVVVSLATLLLSVGLGSLTLVPALRDWLVGSPMRQMALQFVFNVALQAALIYIPVVLLLSERGLLAAFGEGLGFFWRHRVMSLLLVALPFAALIPLSVTLNRPQVLAERFRPETIFTLCQLNIALAALVSLLLTGAVVRFYLYRTRQDRPAATQEARS
ncbi:MAG: hypothetical protein HZB25_05335 [Candidatus Eisenbacteria bacterium]|nr:hypothetical protein [Candidatus Eisenbacteria bacterium]